MNPEYLDDPNYPGGLSTERPTAPPTTPFTPGPWKRVEPGRDRVRSRDAGICDLLMPTHGDYAANAAMIAAAPAMYEKASELLRLWDESGATDDSFVDAIDALRSALPKFS